jgi:TonB family protein
LRGLAVVSFVLLLVAATSAYSPSRLMLTAIPDAGADAGRDVARIFGGGYMPASKSFGGAPLDPQGFGGLGLRGGGFDSPDGSRQGFDFVALRGSGDAGPPSDAQGNDGTIGGGRPYRSMSGSNGLGTLGDGKNHFFRESEPTVAGGLDVKVVRGLAHRYRNQVRYCVETSLPNKDEGKVTLGFVISPAGAVISSRVDDPPGNSELEKCVDVILKQNWKFPKPKGVGTVNVTASFEYGVEP